VAVVGEGHGCACQRRGPAGDCAREGEGLAESKAVRGKIVDRRANKI
jgi:hypothetical protein